MHKKRPKICRVSKAKIYLYHSSKIAKAGPGYDDRTEHPPVQINSSSPWLFAFISQKKQKLSLHFALRMQSLYMNVIRY